MLVIDAPMKMAFAIFMFVCMNDISSSVVDSIIRNR